MYVEHICPEISMHFDILILVEFPVRYLCAKHHNFRIFDFNLYNTLYGQLEGEVIIGEMLIFNFMYLNIFICA